MKSVIPLKCALCFRFKRLPQSPAGGVREIGNVLGHSRRSTNRISIDFGRQFFLGLLRLLSSQRKKWNAYYKLHSLFIPTQQKASSFGSKVDENRHRPLKDVGGSGGRFQCVSSVSEYDTSTDPMPFAF